MLLNYWSVWIQYPDFLTFNKESRSNKLEFKQFLLFYVEQNEKLENLAN